MTATLRARPAKTATVQTGTSQTSTSQAPAPQLVRTPDTHPATASAASPAHLASQVRILTCGSVDDGKSTLIGRLLWDASDLFDDQRETLMRSTRRVLDGTHLDYSLLVDGLLAEREQGITIDIAWRYFDHAGAGDSTRFVIIDSPGHEQYTRNMASGASHADVAVMLIDARHGIKRQTRRHAAILDMFGVKRVILAINKMDLVDWSQARFDEIEADFASLRAKFRFAAAAAIPVAAVTGDNIATRSTNMPWYQGPTLLDQLRAHPAASTAAQPFRMPVQTVLRDGQDFRGLAGTVASGSIAVGDQVIDVLSGQVARVARIATMDRDFDRAINGQAVALVLDRDIDVSRGAVLAHATAQPRSLPTSARELDGRLVWLSEQPYDSDATYLVRTATDLVSASGLQIQAHLDLDTLSRVPATGCVTNDIAIAIIHLARPVALDAFDDLPTTGAFVLVDAVTGATVAAGIVNDVRTSASSRDTKPTPFVLTREILAAGLCRDLGASPADQAEFQRRWNEVAVLLASASGG
jgi:bifunctional enzyme CysN/CysC